MSLSKKEIQKFKEIYKKKFGQDISDQRALELGINLINLYKIIYKPTSKTNSTYGNRDE